MTANVQGSNILDVLKKKMRATKEECEKYKEDCEDIQRKLQVEIMRREEVRQRRRLVDLRQPHEPCRDQCRGSKKSLILSVLSIFQSLAFFIGLN